MVTMTTRPDVFLCLIQLIGCSADSPVTSRMDAVHTAMSASWIGSRPS